MIRATQDTIDGSRRLLEKTNELLKQFQAQSPEITIKRPELRVEHRGAELLRE